MKPTKIPKHKKIADSSHLSVGMIVRIKDHSWTAPTHGWCIGSTPKKPKAEVLKIMEDPKDPDFFQDNRFPYTKYLNNVVVRRQDGATFSINSMYLEVLNEQE